MTESDPPGDAGRPAENWSAPAENWSAPAENWSAPAENWSAPAAWAAPAAGPTGYPGYPMPGQAWPGGPPRPGPVLAAAVLSYLVAGLLIVAGLVLLAGASAVHALADPADSSHNGLTVEFLFDGVANMVTAGLFIAGGTLVSGGNPRGRWLLAVATASTVCFSIYWMVRPSFGFVLGWAVLFAALAIIATGLAFSRSVNDWLKTRPPTTVPAPIAR